MKRQHGCLEIKAQGIILVAAMVVFQYEFQFETFVNLNS
jgi:hypothetical protein